jgi:hypothetical protein
MYSNLVVWGVPVGTNNVIYVWPGLDQRQSFLDTCHQLQPYLRGICTVTSPNTD